MPLTPEERRIQMFEIWGIWWSDDEDEDEVAPDADSDTVVFVWSGEFPNDTSTAPDGIAYQYLVPEEFQWDDN